MGPILKKVLIVEDSKLLHKGYSLILRRYRDHGVEIIDAYNGREGLDQLAVHPDCNLIILDLYMPVMSGLEFLEHLQVRPKLASIPVVIVTTDGQEEQIERGLRAGAAAYLLKPFAPDELHTVISRLTQPPNTANGEQQTPMPA